MKNFIVQSVNEAAQNPTVAKVVYASPTVIGGATWAEWLPIAAGLFGVFMGAIGSGVFIYINLAQHKIKMEIFERDLAESKSRSGRRDRRDD